MSISSSLNAGVAGLNASAMQMATISDNIANASTYGYRRVVTDFSALVNLGSNRGIYSAGGVTAYSTRLIDRGGALLASDNPTDLAVDGRGMLPVTQLGAVGRGGSYPVSLVTTGAFRVDANGLLRTETGLVLMGWPAGSDGSVAPPSRDTMAGLEPVRINTTQVAGDPTTQVGLAVNLPATATEAGAAGDPQSLSVDYYGNLGTTESLEITFTPTVPAEGASNQWTMTIRDSASGGAVIGEYRLTFDGSRESPGLLTGVQRISGGPYDPATGALALEVAGGPLTLDIGAPGELGGMTQLSDSFSPGQISRDGAPVANLLGVEVLPDGSLMGIYDQGFSRRLYQVPLVNVPNPNGLAVADGMSYQVTPQSGAFYLYDAGDGPTGNILGYAREESATDVAAELTQMIQTQRAYSSSVKIIQTADEMLQETTNLKR
ncbi:MAG: flagellar hook-basal body complex protein [Rhodobacterales bacterium]|nr:flagellar hook-basal body complex protein [Rhodobacterales bacterium]